MRKFGRRNFFGYTAAGIGALVVGSPSRSPQAPAPPAQPDAPGLASLIAPFAVGGKVGAHLTIQSVGMRGHVGAIELADASGATVRVDVCQRDGRTPGIANTEHYSFYLCNGGKGDKQTREDRGLAVMALAEAVRRNEPHAAQLTLATKAETWAVA